MILSAAPEELVGSLAMSADRPERRERATGDRYNSSQTGRLPSRLSRWGMLGDRTLYFDTRLFWSSLPVRTDGYKHCWPAPINETTRTPRRFIAAYYPSIGEVFALIDEKRRALTAERKRAGRDVLLSVALDHFDPPREVALDIWNSAPRGRKCGRPKKTKTWY